MQVRRVTAGLGEGEDKILHLHNNAPGYKQHTSHIDFDPFRMILTFISVTNVYIRYPYHPQQTWDL